MGNSDCRNLKLVGRFYSVRIRCQIIWRGSSSTVWKAPPTAMWQGRPLLPLTLASIYFTRSRESPRGLRANMEHIDGSPSLFPHPRPAVSPLFVFENQSSTHTPYSFPTRAMIDQPGSARFQALLDSALQEYEKKAGVTLADTEYSLAIRRLQRCHSIDDITILLQDKAQAFKDLRQRDRISKSIKVTVSILAPISTGAAVTDDVGPVCQKVLRACLAFLTIFTEIAPTYESDTLYSWYPTGRMYHS